ncbi:MAG: hypothetical protein V4726_14905 [Verrucomicrobiota bacterium]
MKRKRSHSHGSKKALGAAALLLLPGTAGAQIFFQAPYGPNGTWRIYETTPGTTATFKDALEAARAAVDPVNGTVHGELASVTSAGKENFLRRSIILLAGDQWMGLTDREGVAPGAQESQSFGIGNRTTGWAFTNGDTYSYMNWNPGEPNNAGAGGAEDAVHFGGAGWNDNQSGYDANQPVVPTLQANSSASENNAPPAFRYVIEYAMNSATPFPNIRVGSIFPPNKTLPGPLNTAGNWSVREVRDLTMAGNIFDAMDQALGGLGTVKEAQSPYLDFTDPDGSTPGGPILTTTPFPFLTNTPDVGDDNILNIAKTRLKITAPGEYTIQVRSDDGFALRIKGRTFTAVNGAGYIDPLDSSTIVYEQGTGDSNTRGLVNLAVGEYDVEFVNWEGGSGAFYEVTSASGNRLNAGEAQWLPLGSSITLPVINTLNTVYLKTNAQVDNANIRDRGAVLPAMRAIMDANIAAGTAISAPRPNLELQEGNAAVPEDLTNNSRMPFNNGITNAEGVSNADQYITKVEGSFKVATDANGNATAGETIDVTFGLFCDDGASMRIIGQDFAAVSTNSTLPELEGDKTLTADFYTGNTNSYGRVQLKEGSTYTFVCYMYEGGGGSNFNLRWQLGDLVTAGFTGGQKALRTTAIGPDDVIGLVADATVTNCKNDWATAPVLPAIRKVLTEAIAQVPRDAGNSGTRNIVLLRESGDGSITGGSFAGTAAIMPVGAVDNYATRVSGKIVVNDGDSTQDEMLELTFGVFADDGADLHIIGQDFTGFGGLGTLTDIGNDTWLTADFFTGNTNAIGNISLKEGEYDLEGHHYEGGGGSGYEIWWAPGTLSAFDAAVFRPLNNTPGQSFPLNTGIPLAAGVAPPATSLELLNFSFVPSTGVYSLTFASNAGSNYAVEYTIGFQAAGVPTNAQKWNVVPGKEVVPGVAGSTTVTGNVNDLILPGGQLPDARKAFFRIKAL